MRTYPYITYRDGKYWMVKIPEIQGLTQSLTEAGVEAAARSYIAVDQDVPPHSFTLTKANP